MKPFHDYWTFSAIRGAMTLLAAFAILAIPMAASSMLSLPVLVALAVDCLAMYCFCDAAVMVLLSNLLPARARRLKPFYAQASHAAVAGLLFFAICIGSISLHWLMWVAAGQAAIAAYTEFQVARQTHAQYGCLSCYSSVFVLAAAALALPFASGLDAMGMTLALAMYIGAYGGSELILGGRMLFVEYRNTHPAHAFSMEWQAKMFKAPVAASLRLRPVPVGLACDACPAAPFCLDDSLPSRLALIVADRVPAIVRSLRVESTLNAAALPVAT